MSNIEALKEQARQHEQKEEWQKACDQYMRAIEQLDDEEQPDIGLYNRVGDLLIRIGNYELALEHFDKAADLYLEADLPNNAIAICKKVIRHLPNRTETYLRMGKIRADQGFLVDARESYLTYVEKVQGAGDMEEALRALGEFAELAPEDTEVRMAVAEQLIQHEREEEALEQLSAGYAVLRQREDDEAAGAFEEKILELDPDADLEALAEASPVREETFEESFGFESTALDDAFAGDAFEDEVTADFGEIVLGDDDPGDDGDGDGDEQGEAVAGEDEAGGVEVGEFALSDVAGDEGADEEPAGTVEAEEGEGEELAVGDFQEIALGDEDEDEDEDEDGEEDVALPFIALDEEEEDLPLLSEFVEDAVAADEQDAADAADEYQADEYAAEEAEPLPFLTDDEGDEASIHGDEPVPEDFGLDTDTVTVDEVDEDEIADVLAEAMEEAAGEEDPREAWASLLDRLDAGEPEVESAQELVELAFKLDDQDALVRSYLHLADALVAEGDEDRAQGVYEQVLSLDPDNDRARAALEEEEEASGGEAEPAGEDAGAQDYVDLGSLIFDEEKEKTTRFRVEYEEPSGDEEADFARMLSQFKAKVAENFDVSDVKAHHDLGTAYKEMGLLDEAVEKFQEALRASPGHLPTYELLGQTFMDKGQPIAAVRVLERALKVPHEIEDELIGIYYFLARAQEEVGNTDAAIEFYDRVFALDINFGDVTERLRKLR